MASHVDIIYGAASFGNYPPWTEDDAIEKCLSILKLHNISDLDTAQIYGGSEKAVGRVKAGDRFNIHTKWIGGWIPSLKMSKEHVVESAKTSLQTLGVQQVDIFHIHAPNYSTPFEETLEGVNEAYKLGIFKRFGLSNFTSEDVEKVYAICIANGYVLPTVYQGNYSAVTRRAETNLFPTLRRLGIAFHAYSPLGGGFLTKTKQQVIDGMGRFAENHHASVYRKMFNRPAMLGALEKWAAIAEEEGVDKAEMGYRWATWNSLLRKDLGDAMLFNSSTLAQLEGTLSSIEKGPLSSKAVKAIDELWESIKHEAPIDTFADL